MKKNIFIAVILLVFASGCGPSQEDIQQAIDVIAQGIEAIPIESQDVLDGLDGNSSSFSIESEEKDILIECVATLVNPNYQRMNIKWTFTNFKSVDSGYAINGTIDLKLNGWLNMSTYAGKAVFTFDLDGGEIDSLYLVYTENNRTGKINTLKANGKTSRFPDVVKISKRLEVAFQSAVE